MAKKADRTIYGVQAIESKTPGGKVKKRFGVVRLADGKVMSQHNAEADADDQANGLEARAKRAA